MANVREKISKVSLNVVLVTSKRKGKIAQFEILPQRIRCGGNCLLAIKFSSCN
jgi:hypothetical protein